VGGPGPEVTEKALRRRFTVSYKRRILEAADRCQQAGERGALLRREGLYFSHLNTWRKQREEGTLQGLAPKKRGRKATPQNPLAQEAERLVRENEQLRQRLRQAETIIECQKKLSEILGIPLADTESTRSDA
jgi:transposase-like protein